MGQSLKILIIGLGSIGRRHLKHLESIPNLEIAALRSSKGQLKTNVDIQEFTNIDDAIKFKPDGVIIANPTSMHVESALPFLKLGSKVLIEKPIDHTIENAKNLEQFEELIRVAYCLRFSPVYIELQKIFEKNPPFKIGFKRSYYLPKWHPYADYREEYTAKKSLGGGIIRTISHEIDLAIHWYGFPIEINGVIDKVSHLEIDTDDYAFFSLKTDSNSRINFELDFFSPNNINQGEAYTNEGVYRWNYSDIFFTPYTDTEAQLINSYPDSIDTMYQNQILDFIDFINNMKSNNCTFKEALQTLLIIDKVEKN